MENQTPPEAPPPERPNPERKAPLLGGNVILYSVAVLLALSFLFMLVNSGQEVDIPIVYLVKLIELGSPETNPKAAITVTEGDKGNEKTTKYSNLHELLVTPQEIKGQVTMEVLGPTKAKKPPEDNVKFVSGRAGTENDNGYLLQLLKDKGFDKARAEKSPGTLKTILPSMILIGFLLVIFYIMLRKLGGAGSAMAFGRSRGKLYAQEEVGITFRHVAGVDEAVDEVREVVDFLKSPEKYQVLGGRIPKGVLLVGPPGTGKTLLAKAIAGEAGVPFFCISGSDFVEMFVGVGAARVRDMFVQAQAKAPCIIFIDELDALGKTRGSGVVGGHDEREQTLNALLVEMDGFSSNSGVIVMAATNRPETLDPALLRPGRFDRHVLVDRPDILGREAILKVHVAQVKMDASVDLKAVAKITPGLCGADLANLVNEAALLAARAGKSAVTMQEFNEGVERVIAGLEKRQRVMHADEKQRVAYHESGHALVSYSLPNTDPVHKVSIIPRGFGALGYVMHRPEGDRFLTTQSELESRIQGLLAGTVAEELIYDDISTGAQNDLERATGIARGMVMDYGMSRLGRVTFRETQRSPFLSGGDEVTRERAHSEVTSREIDEEIRRIIAESLVKVRHILDTRRKALVAITERLIEKEVIDMAELREIIEQNSPSPMIVPGTGDTQKRAFVEAEVVPEKKETAAK
jgi:cell division protease FtsH